MKRGKDGEKLLGPMFPRLHVNDAEKGGPRAPPRNKMALYEQLSIPSQRFNPGLSPGKTNSNSSVPPSSSSQVSGMDRKNFFPLHLPLSKPTHLPEKLNGQQNNSADEDDFSVPVFARSLEGQEKNQNSKESENVAPLNLNHTHHHSPRIQTQNSGPQRNSVEPENIHGEESKEADDGSRESGNNESLRDIAVENASEPRRESISGNTERSDDVSEASMLDSISAMDISPDDVVGIIGQKHFWKARRAIVNQQRVFAVQVFELHRLIKVQKLMASSPHLLLEDTSTTLSKPSSKSSPAAKVLAEYNKSQSPAPKNRGEHDKPTHPVECSAENAVGRTSIVSNKSALPGPPTGSNSGPWCPTQQQSPGQQQWLIPMMSPTEGLVYKPYPAAGFNSTGFCGPYGSSPVMIGNFGNPAYGVPSHQGMGFVPGIPHGCHSYFPTYGMPVMNVGASGASSGCISSIDAGNRQAESTPAIQTSHDQRQELNHPQHQSSCNNNNNVSVPRTAPTGTRLQTPKISDIQGSTGSSHPNDRAKPTQAGSSNNPCPPDETQGAEAGSSNGRTKELGNVRSGERKDELQLFPMAPATTEADRSARVIRAVPHNPRSASASVARIFMSIQEERKHYDSV